MFLEPEARSIQNPLFSLFPPGVPALNHTLIDYAHGGMTDLSSAGPYGWVTILLLTSLTLYVGRYLSY